VLESANRIAEEFGELNTPHPTDDRFAEAYGQAWTSAPERLPEFFAPDGSYTDVAMDATYSGRDEVARFHRWMLRFAPDSVIEFTEPCAFGGRLYLEWQWSGTFNGTLRLPNGDSVDATGQKFRVPGVAACRYRADGKLLTHRDYWDLSAVLHQVDAPTPS
jgi:steroid delta-isomerase-like uncharacterized protein